MKAVVPVGPITIAIDASHYSFQFYEEGIYYNPARRSKDLDHGILGVGYGFEGAESDNNKYCTVENSWDTAWGEKGPKTGTTTVELPPRLAILLCEMMVIKKDLIENWISKGGILS